MAGLAHQGDRAETTGSPAARRRTMNRNPENQSRLCTWAFHIEGHRHILEIEQAYSSGERLIWLDGALVPDSGTILRLSGTYSFAILGCDCELVVNRKSEAGGAYKLRVNGIEVSPLYEFSEQLLRPSSA